MMNHMEMYVRVLRALLLETVLFPQPARQTVGGCKSGCKSEVSPTCCRPSKYQSIPIWLLLYPGLRAKASQGGGSQRPSSNSTRALVTGVCFSSRSACDLCLGLAPLHLCRAPRPPASFQHPWLEALCARMWSLAPREALSLPT